jgi:hypothetical protein
MVGSAVGAFPPHATINETINVVTMPKLSACRLLMFGLPVFVDVIFDFRA